MSARNLRSSWRRATASGRTNNVSAERLYTSPSGSSSVSSQGEHQRSNAFEYSDANNATHFSAFDAVGEDKRKEAEEDHREEEEEEEDEEVSAALSRLFRKFCSSSTIHGTYYWMETDSWAGRAFWLLVVFVGVVMAGFIIRSSFAGWKDNPVITSVAQKSIEAIPFPAITVCPTDDNE